MEYRREIPSNFSFLENCIGLPPKIKSPAILYTFIFFKNFFTQCPKYVLNFHL